MLVFLLQDFHRLTGLRTVVFDTYGMDILYLAGAACLLRWWRRAGRVIGCPTVRPKTLCRHATRRKETVIYTCHAGLIEVITPILIDGAAVGLLLPASPYRKGADEARVPWLLSAAQSLRYRRSGAAQRLRCPAPHPPDAEIGIGPAGVGGVRAVINRVWRG